MPKMNGFELYRRIKEKNPAMKIAFITAFEINREEFNKVLPSIDVKDFIIKPISMSDLIIKAQINSDKVLTDITLYRNDGLYLTRKRPSLAA